MGGAAHAELARRLGAACARRGIELVFGGGAVGLMGVLADAALAAGGRVVGVIPDFLEQPEIAHPGVSEMIVVDGMHARKLRMFERADAFAALPGGIGTLDETVEIVTWKLLGLHDKPVVLVDDGYWRPFLALIEHMVGAGFADARTRAAYTVVDTLDGLFAALAAGPAPHLAADAARL
jgi:uncharacterized protein (TIGR00730 family)